MNGVLLMNGNGELGLALVEESRRISRINYLSNEQNLQVEFGDGSSDVLLTPIAEDFVRAMFQKKKVFVGHFSGDGTDRDPSAEYHVPLTL